MGQKGIVHLSKSVKNKVEEDFSRGGRRPWDPFHINEKPTRDGSMKHFLNTPKDHHPANGMMVFITLEIFIHEFLEKGLGLTGQGKMTREQVFFSIINGTIVDNAF